MKIIISPAKKMNTKLDVVEFYELPRFIDYTEEIMKRIKSLNYHQVKELWKCNDNIATQNYERFQNMKLREKLTPAILAYEGIQYQYMAPTVFEVRMLEYIQKNLCILSGFYGALRPMDGVVPYRLEMQAKLSVENKNNLYEYWGDKIYQIIGETEPIINLASKEYSVCVERYLSSEAVYITCIFGELVGEKVVQKGTYAKMARGEMVRFMAENNIEDIEGIKKFNCLGYEYKNELSTENSFVFIKSKSI